MGIEIKMVQPDVAKHDASLSPSLIANQPKQAPAYEMKFLLSLKQAEQLEALLRQHCLLDPHADPTLGHAYRVTSVYLDTPERDVLKRTPGHRRHKFRVRRYGLEPTLYLERKSKKQGRVWKKRCAVAVDEVHEVLATPPEAWLGMWFARAFAKRKLQPVCRLTYERMAFIGSSPTGATRVTLDRALRCLPANDLSAGVFVGGAALLVEHVVVEFKYLDTMPVFFKDLMAQLGLSPSRVSKYRQAAQATGLIPAEGQRHA